MNVIEARGLTRFYGLQRGVENLELDVPEGSIFGLLGENGSGKTTAIKLAMGALVPDRGTVRTLGCDPALIPAAVRARIGYLADDLEVPGWMSLGEAMALQSAYFPAWDAGFAQELMKRLELVEGMVYEALSKGQRRRFLLTLILATRPELLVLDEPAGGLDTQVRRQFIDLLLEMFAHRMMTIVVSSHILGDIERLVDHIAIVRGGRIIQTGQLEELKTRMKRLVLTAPGAEQEVRRRFKVLGLHWEEDALLAVVEDFAPERLDGMDAVVEHLNLEEIYLAINAGQAVTPAVEAAL